MSPDKSFSVKEYRDLVGKVRTVTVPSGAKFEVKRLSVLDYIKEGIEDIPNDFLSFVSELVGGQLQVDTEERRKNLELFEKYIKITVEKGIVQPPVVLKYDKDKVDTHLIYSEMTPDDQKYLIDAVAGRV
jgi:hypothetical protein